MVFMPVEGMGNKWHMEKWSCDVGLMRALAIHKGSSGTRVTLQSCLRLGHIRHKQDMGNRGKGYNQVK